MNTQSFLDESSVQSLCTSLIVDECLKSIEYPSVVFLGNLIAYNIYIQDAIRHTQIFSIFLVDNNIQY